MVLELPSFADVKECNDGAGYLALVRDRMRPILSRKARAISAPKNFIFHMSTLVVKKCPKDSALFHWIGRSIWPRMVHELVHIPAEKLARVRVAEKVGAR